jgi:hypothetical protein
MRPFDYVMTLVSIVIGLGITHVLSALGTAVHRLRGHGMAIRLEPVYLLWVGFVLVWQVSFWWWEFKLNELPIDWTFGLYLFLLGYALGLFLMVVILVPAGMDGVADSYAYFMSGRRWFMAVVLLCLVLDVFDTMFKGTGRILRQDYVILNTVLALACVVAMWSARRSVQWVCAIVAFAYQGAYIWQAMGILGRW